MAISLDTELYYTNLLHSSCVTYDDDDNKSESGNETKKTILTRILDNNRTQKIRIGGVSPTVGKVHVISVENLIYNN